MLAAAGTRGRSSRARRRSPSSTSGRSGSWTDRGRRPGRTRARRPSGARTRPPRSPRARRRRSRPSAASSPSACGSSRLPPSTQHRRQPRASRRRVDHRRRALVVREPGVGERQRAQRVAELAGARDVRAREPEPLARQVLAPALGVERVGEVDYYLQNVFGGENVGKPYPYGTYRTHLARHGRDRPAPTSTSSTCARPASPTSSPRRATSPSTCCGATRTACRTSRRSRSGSPRRRSRPSAAPRTARPGSSPGTRSSSSPPSPRPSTTRSR